MKSLLIRHEIKIPGIPVVGTPALTFHGWLPVNEPIISEDDGKVIKIWFDLTNTSHKSLNEVKKQQNVLVRSAYVDLTLKNFDENLIEVLKANRKLEESEKKILEPLGQEVYLAVTDKINRLTDWANSVKQQYWLANIPVELGKVYPFNIESDAKAIILPESENEWFRWNPIRSQGIKVVMTHQDSYITIEDWPKLTEFVNSKRRTNLKFELISRAFTLNGLTLRTNALIDGVTALEISISDFAKSPNLDQIKFEHLLKRINVNSLENALKHLGFSRFVQYLLPLILDEKIIAKMELETINNALVSRNNVVHNGQRELDESKSIKYLVSIKNLIVLLDELS